MSKKRIPRPGRVGEKHHFKKKNANGKNDTRPVIYDREFVLKEAQAMLSDLTRDKGIAGGHEIYFLGQLFAKRFYSPQKFSEWANKFEGDAEISEALRKIDSILEARLWVGGLQGVLNAGMTKFLLINKHGAREIEKVEMSGRMENTLLIQDILRKSKEEEDPK